MDLLWPDEISFFRASLYCARRNYEDSVLGFKYTYSISKHDHQSEIFRHFNVNNTVSGSMNKCRNIVDLGSFQVEKNAHNKKESVCQPFLNWTESVKIINSFCLFKTMHTVTSF